MKVNNRIPKLLFVFVPFLLILTVALFAFLYFSEDDNGIANVQITNLTSNSASIVWETESETAGEILVSKEDKWKFLEPLYSNKDTFYDDRNLVENEEGSFDYSSEIVKDRRIHHVTVRNLEPETEYFFQFKGKLKTFKSDVSSFKTFDIQDEIKEPDTIYGQIRDSIDQEDDPTDGIVLWFIKDAEQKPVSQKYSSLVNDSSGWNGDLNSVTDGEGVTVVRQDGDQIDIEVLTNDSSGADSFLLNDYKPTGDVFVNFSYIPDSNNVISVAKIENSSPAQSVAVADIGPCSVTCSQGAQFSDPNPYTFGSCGEWASEACGTAGQSSSEVSSGSNNNDSGNTTPPPANNSSDNSNSSKWTCGSENYGTHCVDTKGKPRCISTYLEACGSNLYRRIECGSGGEFRDRSGCIFDSNGNVQTTKEEADSKLTCPLGSWPNSDETRCISKDENGNEEENDLQEGGHNVTIHGTSTEDANNAMSQENDNAGGGSVSQTTLNALNASLAIEAENETAFNQCASSCTNQPRDISSCITQCKSTTFVSNSCSSNINRSCPDSLFDGYLGEGETIESVSNLVRNNHQTCRAVTSGDRILEAGAGTCVSQDSKASGSNEPPVNTNITFIENSQGRSSLPYRIIPSSSMAQALYDEGVFINDYLEEVEQQCANFEYTDENAYSSCAKDILVESIDNNSAYDATVSPTIDIATTPPPAIDYVCLSSASAQEKFISCWSDIVRQYEPGEISEKSNTCSSLESEDERVECFLKAFSAGEYKDVDKEELFNQYCEGKKNEEKNCNNTPIGANADDEACEDENLTYNESITCLNEAWEDARTSEGSQSFDIRNFNFLPISRVNAQSNEVPTPMAVDIKDLDAGNYLIKDQADNFTTLEIVGNGKYAIRFFYDANEDGVRQDDEIVFDNEVLSFTVSKEKDYSTYNLQAGWNAITLDSINEDYDTAQELILELQKQGIPAIQISKYTPGNWTQFVARYSNNLEFTTYGTDFNLIPGEGYFVRTLEGGSVTLEGNVFTSAVPISLMNGWNLIGVQSPNQTYSSESFMNMCLDQGGICTNISKYENSRYESYVKDEGQFFGNNFNLLDTEGYFVLNIGENKVLTP